MQPHALEILKKYWGYDQFRPAQEPIVDAILQGKDTLAMLPTGGGKSLCFQVPAMAKEGVCLVISPLISLMEDQVRNLSEKGIPALALTGSIPHYELERLLGNVQSEAYKFVYMAPERLSNELVLYRLQHTLLSYIVIDEAHCISHWGKDFRPAYLECQKLKQWFPALPIVALTATATDRVQEDILQLLQIPKATVIKGSLARPTLAYMTYYIEDKWERMGRILTKNKESSIVYVRNRRLTEELAQHLCDEGFTATSFHGGLSTEEKSQRLGMWKAGNVQVVVATNAFGMGIDKPDVRLVLHLTMPSSLEEYFQEAGRAGRDGQRAYAVAIVSRRDSQLLQRRLEDSFPPKDYIRHCYDQLCNYLEIGEGEGLGRSYSVDVEHFIRLFHMRPVQTYHALEIMQLARWLRYEEDGGRSRLMFLIPSSQLYQPHIGPDKLIRAILRSYTGLFSSYVSIYEPDLAEATGYTVEEIYEHLARLGRIGVLHYIPQRQVPRVTFLVRREESRLLQIAPEAYEERRRRMADRIACVRSYIEAEETCRSRMLLAYFGEEEAVPCGCCDVCLTRHPSGLHQYVIDACREALERLFLTTERPSLPVVELVASLPYPELEVYQALRYWASELDGLVLDGAHLRREV